MSDELFSLIFRVLMFDGSCIVFFLIVRSLGTSFKCFSLVLMIDGYCFVSHSIVILRVGFQIVFFNCVND